MTPGPRILIVDDHASVRDGIRAFLENKTNFTVCGEADDGVTAIEQTKVLKPDLIIMDLVLPRMNGIEASSVLKSTFPGVKIVAFSMYADELGRAVAAASRIDAVLTKSSGLAVLAETIRRLLNMPPPPVNPSGGSPQSCSPAQPFSKQRLGSHPLPISEPINPKLMFEASWFVFAAVEIVRFLRSLLL